MTKIIIDTDEVHGLVEQGGKFVFKKEAELALVDLLTLKEFIEEKISEAKENIANAGTSINPNFRGVIGDSVKAIYRVYGEKYGYEATHKESLEEREFLKKSENYKVDSKRVDEYFAKTGKLPEGVHLKERQKVISFTLDKHEGSPQLHTTQSLDAGEG